MAGYYPLAAPEIRNAMVDFSPLNDAISGYKDAVTKNSMLQYQGQRDKVADQRSNAMLSIQQNQEKRAQKQFSREQSDAAIKRYAGVLQSIEAYPPEQRQALYAKARQSMAQHDPEFESELKGYGVNADDFASVAPFVYGIARGYQPPAKPEVKEVNGRLVAVSSPSNGGQPSATEIYNAANQPGGAFANPKDRANVEESLRKEYATLAKPYFEVRDAYSRVEQSAANPSAAGDLALIFNYMKMLDPGSVVREGEFATAQSAAGVPDRIWNLYNRMLSGERLNPQQRDDFIGQARGLFQRQEQQYQGIQEQYRGIAERTGVDTRNTIVDFGRPASPNAQSEASSISGGPMAPRSAPTQPGAQGQIPPGAVQYLRSNPTPDIIQQFEQKYGPGSAQQFLGR